MASLKKTRSLFQHGGFGSLLPPSPSLPPPSFSRSAIGDGGGRLRESPGGATGQRTGVYGGAGARSSARLPAGRLSLPAVREPQLLPPRPRPLDKPLAPRTAKAPPAVPPPASPRKASGFPQGRPQPGLPHLSARSSPSPAKPGVTGPDPPRPPRR